MSEEKWIYNKETNEVWEEVFEDGSSIVGHKRAIPKNVKVEWRDGDDVTRKFKKQHQELRSDWCNVDEDTYNEAGEQYRRIVAIPIKQEQPIEREMSDERIEEATMWCEIIVAIGEADKKGENVGSFISRFLELNYTIKRRT